MHVTGGYQKAPIPLTTKSHSVRGSHKCFVKMSPKRPWLLKTTCSPHVSVQRAYRLARRSLLCLLRGKLLQACNGTIRSEEVEGEADDEDRDRTEEIGMPDQSQTSPIDQSQSPRGAKRARYTNNEMRNRIFVTSVRKYCPEEDPHCEQMRQITMLIVDRKTIWLCTEDMEWAVRYLWAQNNYDPGSAAPLGRFAQASEDPSFMKSF